MDYPRYIDLAPDWKSELRVLNPRYMMEKMSTERVLDYYRKHVQTLPIEKTSIDSCQWPGFENASDFAQRIIKYKNTVKKILDNREHVEKGSVAELG